ncbi:MAG TPA: MBL fold metallo-hydrolase [Aliiroseovarius sp.]|nr:MBL fold metallo-hydrolase [Aliiroseovarius sp.]
MRITFAGCGDAFGSGGRFNTCFHVTAGASRFLIDCGASSLTALRRAGIGLNAIETIFATLFHGDHFGGIPYFLPDAPQVINRDPGLTPGLTRRRRALLRKTAAFCGSGGGFPGRPEKFPNRASSVLAEP